MLMLSGLGGLGDYSAFSDCSMIPAGDPYRTSGNLCLYGGCTYGFNDDGSTTPVDSTCTPNFPTATSTTTPNATTQAQQAAMAQGNTGVPWWQSIITGVAAGTTSALVPKPGMPMIKPITAPWYTTPTGMGAIAIAVLLGAYIITKK